MTIKEISMEEVIRSVREMTGATIRASMEAVEILIADINKAAEAAQEALGKLPMVKSTVKEGEKPV